MSRWYRVVPGPASFYPTWWPEHVVSNTQYKTEPQYELFRDVRSGIAPENKQRFYKKNFKTGYRYLSSQFSVFKLKFNSIDPFVPSYILLVKFKHKPSDAIWTNLTHSFTSLLNLVSQLQMSSMDKFTAPSMHWTTPGDLHKRFKIFKQNDGTSSSTAPQKIKRRIKRRDYAYFGPAIKA